jgi:hypothetical protein
MAKRPRRASTTGEGTVPGRGYYSLPRVLGTALVPNDELEVGCWRGGGHEMRGGIALWSMRSGNPMSLLSAGSSMSL